MLHFKVGNKCANFVTPPIPNTMFKLCNNHIGMVSEKG